MSYIEELFSLKGYVVVITGGGGVIPGSIAESLFRAGAKVSLWGWRKQSIESKKNEIIEKYNNANRIHTYVVNTENEIDVANALKATIKEFGNPNILVNGVGGNKGKSSFIDTDIRLFEDILKLNLLAGLVIPAKVFSKFWINNKIEGNIINIASMASYIPLSKVWAYDAAKAGVINLTMALAKELAPYKIRVNAIAPGFFLGKQNKNLLMDEKTGKLTERGKAIIEHTPYKRFGKVSDLSGISIYLASKNASNFVTGICIPVDGGYLINNI